ncbi:MAG: hypothetical protein A2857_01485 [Candidatus Levybacteria bacterium RIFCSPHIGHO2_01_FULL_36_15]|nr:MAG: hypothetical protein A2857_01485 [Candidatus Levybacteria bacterium RIFCSPHIGHO2_01_FULL_36_15]OGH39279.1 MAG: hypothetical protein A2905_00245 [Candidatus Levybacteria bacterium RIFCSPLOWO2_01_FULL_36_10]
MQLSGEHRTEVEKAIVELIAASIENGSLGESDLPVIADFVLTKIDVLQTQEELVSFLSELSLKWPVFSNVQTLEQGKITQKAEDQALNSALDLAKEGKIDEAVDLARTATEPAQSPQQ